jgi:hypothetical protein
MPLDSEWVPYGLGTVPLDLKCISPDSDGRPLGLEWIAGSPVNSGWVPSDSDWILLHPEMILPLLTPIAEKLSASKTKILSRKFMASFLGTISGYHVGYWVATWVYLPNLDSGKIKAVVGVQNTWILWEKFVSAGILCKAKNVINDIEDIDKKNKYDKLWKSVYMPINEKDGDLMSSDVDSLLMLYNEIVPSRKAFIDKLLFFYFPWSFFCLFIALFAYFGVSKYIDARKAKKLA